LRFTIHFGLKILRRIEASLRHCACNPFASIAFEPVAWFSPSPSTCREAGDAWEKRVGRVTPNAHRLVGAP
jgi:hypothetical protein